MSDKYVPAWNAQPLIDRLKTCRVMLYQHGMLTDTERKRVDQRIDKREAQMGNQDVEVKA